MLILEYIYDCLILNYLISIIRIKGIRKVFSWPDFDESLNLIHPALSEFYGSSLLVISGVVDDGFPTKILFNSSEISVTSKLEEYLGGFDRERFWTFDMEKYK